NPGRDADPAGIRDYRSGDPQGGWRDDFQSSGRNRNLCTRFSDRDGRAAPFTGFGKQTYGTPPPLRLVPISILIHILRPIMMRGRIARRYYPLLQRLGIEPELHHGSLVRFDICDQQFAIVTLHPNVDEGLLFMTRTMRIHLHEGSPGRSD